MVGFVYIWYDRARTKFYIGSHAGSLNDGYVCSSTWMKRAYNKRPQDFRRKILFYSESITRDSLLKEEARWLNMIKKTELKTRYYNIIRSAGNPWAHTTDTSYERLCDAQKKRWVGVDRSGDNNNVFKGYYITPWGKFNTGVKAIDSAPFPIPHVRSFYNWCKTEFTFRGSSRQKHIPKNWIGKSSRELGFTFEKVI